LILDLKRRGITVLLSSHLLAQVQEICDRIGILANGVLVREGRLEELLTVSNRTEVLLENASPELLETISTAASRAGARVVATRPSQTSLERLFLDSTEGPDQPQK
jgi:ABC-2 type transport system ATP-binding protein